MFDATDAQVKTLVKAAATSDAAVARMVSASQVRMPHTEKTAMATSHGVSPVSCLTRCLCVGVGRLPHTGRRWVLPKQRACVSYSATQIGWGGGNKDGAYRGIVVIFEFIDPRLRPSPIQTQPPVFGGSRHCKFI